MSHLVSKTGVILKKNPYGESDEIVTILFEGAEGVRRVFAPASRKSKKRFSGLIDVFATLNFEVRVPQDGMWRLQSADDSNSAVSNRFWQSDLSSYAFFSYVAELICEFMPEALHNAALFCLWQEAVAGFSKNGFSHSRAEKLLSQLLDSFGYGGDSNAGFADLIKRFRHILQKSLKSERFLMQLVMPKELPVSSF